MKTLKWEGEEETNALFNNKQLWPAGTVVHILVAMTQRLEHVITLSLMIEPIFFVTQNPFHSHLDS